MFGTGPLAREKPHRRLGRLSLPVLYLDPAPKDRVRLPFAPVHENGCVHGDVKRPIRMNSDPLTRVDLEKILAENRRELLGSLGWDCSALPELRLMQAGGGFGGAIRSLDCFCHEPVGQKRN